MWGVQKTHNLIKEYTYRVRTLIWPFYFNLDLCALTLIRNLPFIWAKIQIAQLKVTIIVAQLWHYAMHLLENTIKSSQQH